MSASYYSKLFILVCKRNYQKWECKLEISEVNNKTGVKSKCLPAGREKTKFYHPIPAQPHKIYFDHFTIPSWSNGKPTG